MDQKAQQRSASASSSIDFDFLGTVPNSVVALCVSGGSDYKEPYGTSPSSYFWLLTNLLESLLNDGEFSAQAGAGNNVQNLEQEMANAEFSVDFDAVAAEIAKYLMERPFYESKHARIRPQEASNVGRRHDREQQQFQLTDAGLVGLLQTAIAIIKFNPSWKFSQDGLVSVDFFWTVGT